MCCFRAFAVFLYGVDFSVYNTDGFLLFFAYTICESLTCVHYSQNLFLTLLTSKHLVSLMLRIVLVDRNGIEQ